MKRLITVNIYTILASFIVFCFVYFPQTSMNFEAYNRYIDIPSSQSSVEYVLPAKMPYTMKYVVSAALKDEDVAISVNGRELAGVNTVVRGDQKTFKCDIPEDYFVKGKNRIEFSKKAVEPEGFTDKFTLRNFKKNIFDLNIYIVFKPSASYFKLLKDGITFHSAAALIVYFLLIVMLSAVIADPLLLKFTSVGYGRLYACDLWINALIAVITFVFLILQFILPYNIVMVPLTKYFSIFVFFQMMKFSLIIFFYFIGKWGERLFTVFLGLFVSFVLFLLTDMEAFARFFANIAYIFLAVSVILMAIQARREGLFDKKR